MLYFRKLRMVLNLEIFKKLYILALFREHFHKYFEMLLHAKFKDFSFMQNQRLLKTFGGH